MLHQTKNNSKGMDIMAEGEKFPLKPTMILR